MLEFDPPICPECGGDGYPLGTLGHLYWCRCRDCGSTFDVNVDESSEDPQPKDSHAHAST